MGKQRGNSLIIVLIVVAILASLSARIYEMSLLEHKSLQQYISKTSAFYNAERCLDKPVDVSTIVSTKSIHTHAARITALVGKNLSWWKKNALPCGENTWVYLQFLWKDALNENVYYRISAYHEKHILLQVVIKNSVISKQSTRTSWRQLL